MPLFPNLDPTNPNNVNAVPISTQSLNQYDSLTNPFFVDPNFINQVDDVIFVGNNKIYANKTLKNKEEVDSIISSGILEGMIITRNATNPNNIDISAGKFVVATSQSGLEDTIVDFAGAQNISVTNTGNNSLLFVYVDSSSSFSFLGSPSSDVTLCRVGEIAMSFITPANIFAIYNNGDRLFHNRNLFTEYINSYGMFHNGISIKRNNSAGFSTDGGYVSFYSQENPKLVQSNQAIPFVPISSLGTQDTEIVNFTISFLKNYYSGDTLAGTINNANEHLIWVVYVGIDGKFYLLKPQSRIVFSGNLRQGDVLNYLYSLTLPILIEDFCAPVCAITINGTLTNLNNLILHQIKNRLSSGLGFINSSVGGGTVTSYTIPIASPLVSADEPVGTTQLATDGTQYTLIKGIEGLDTTAGNVPVAYNLNTKKIGTIQSKGLPDNKAFWIRTDLWATNRQTVINNTNNQFKTNIANLSTTTIDNTISISSNTGWIQNVASSLPDGAGLCTANSNYHVFCLLSSNSYSFGSTNYNNTNFLLESQNIAKQMYANFKKAGVRLTQRADWNITTDFSTIYNVPNIDYKFPFIAMHSHIVNRFAYSCTQQLDNNYNPTNSGHNIYTYFCGYSNYDRSFYSEYMSYVFNYLFLKNRTNIQRVSVVVDSGIAGYFFIKKGL